MEKILLGVVETHKACEKLIDFAPALDERKYTVQSKWLMQSALEWATNHHHRHQACTHCIIDPTQAEHMQFCASCRISCRLRATLLVLLLLLLMGKCALHIQSLLRCTSSAKVCRARSSEFHLAIGTIVGLCFVHSLHIAVIPVDHGG